MTDCRPNSAPQVIARSLCAGYTTVPWSGTAARRIIVDRFHHAFEGGTITAILGPNASGKSTLLRAIVDRKSRYSGSVLSWQRPIAQASIAYVPQHAALTLRPWARTWEEITTRAHIAGMSRKRRQKLATRLMAEYGVELPLQRRVDQLSGGQKVKVAILRALADGFSSDSGGRLMVLDEPLEGVDAESRSGILQIIAAAARSGMAVVITSHRAEDLSTIATTTVRADGIPITRLVPANDSRSAGPPSHADAFDVAPSSGQASRLQRALPVLMLGALGFVAGLGVWQLAATIVANAALLPSPLHVGASILKIALDPESQAAFRATMGRAAIGWALAVLSAIPVGVLLGFDARVYRLAAPWLSLLRAVPLFVLAGVATGILPRQPEAQRIFLIWLTLFVIGLHATSVSAALAPRRRMDLARVFGASHWYRYRILCREAIGGAFTCLEVTLPLSIVVSFVVELFLIPNTGLGIYAFNHMDDADKSTLFAYILIPGVVAAVGLSIIRAVSKRFRYEI